MLQLAHTAKLAPCSRGAAHIAPACPGSNTSQSTAPRPGLARPIPSNHRTEMPLASCQRGGQKFVVSKAKATIATLERSQGA